MINKSDMEFLLRVYAGLPGGSNEHTGDYLFDATNCECETDYEPTGGWGCATKVKECQNDTICH